MLPALGAAGLRPSPQPDFAASRARHWAMLCRAEARSGLTVALGPQKLGEHGTSWGYPVRVSFEEKKRQVPEVPGRLPRLPRPSRTQPGGSEQTWTRGTSLKLG